MEISRSRALLRGLDVEQIVQILTSNREDSDHSVQEVASFPFGCTGSSSSNYTMLKTTGLLVAMEIDRLPVEIPNTAFPKNSTTLTL